MKSVVLGHCYTTENKGDAGIVIATIETMRAHVPDVRIQGISTFASRDDAFLNHHEDFKSAGAEMVPALLPEDKLFIAGRVMSSSPAKAVSFVKNVAALIIGYGLYRLRPGLSFPDLRQTLSALEQCDIFVSKGGSFIYNEGGARGDLSLFKILVPFMVAKAFGKRTVILAQSLGPFNTKASKRLFKYFLRYIDKIYIREDRCLRYLDYLEPDLYRPKIDFCPDLAFALCSEGYAPMLAAEGSDICIGMTIVNYRFSSEERRQNYIDVLVKTIAHFKHKFPEAQFYVFPQVLSPQTDGSVDVELSSVVKRAARELLDVDVELVYGDFDARVLRETYRRMRFFVATRLHSSIFAASVGTPTIVFGYHGTKAEGIWNDLGYGRFFFSIDTVSWKQVEAALEEIVTEERHIVASLLEKTEKWRKEINEVIHKEIVQIS